MVLNLNLKDFLEEVGIPTASGQSKDKTPRTDLEVKAGLERRGIKLVAIYHDGKIPDNYDSGVPQNKLFLYLNGKIFHAEVPVPSAYQPSEK